MEWIDPRYADLVAAWKLARQQQDSRTPEQPPRPMRAFIVPPKG